MEEIAMTITKTAENGTLRIALEGRLDTNTAPQLEAAWSTSPPRGCGCCWPPRRR